MSARRWSLNGLAAPAVILIAGACSSSNDSPAMGGTPVAAGGQPVTAGAGGTPGGVGGGMSGTNAGAPAGGSGTAMGGAPPSGGATAGGGTNAGGATANAGASAGGMAASGGANAGGMAASGGANTGGTGGAPAGLDKFSFFVTSLKAMRILAKSELGFGGDLRYGTADGLSGADKICTEVAERSMPGSGAKTWRAFLSVYSGPGGMPVNAIDRIGNGPWYDRVGRVVAMNKADLLNTRPANSDPVIREDLPNEDGAPNHRPDPALPEEDNHHVLTGSNAQGAIYTDRNDATCNDWTSKETNIGRPRFGYSWSVSNRVHWYSGGDEGGCGAGFDVDGGGGPNPSNPIVGSGGGYGGIYCFALSP